MKKIFFSLIFLFLFSVCSGVTLESKEVAYLEQALDFTITIPPNGASVVYFVTPLNTKLLQWIMRYDKVEYDYEVVGVSTIHKWTFLEKNSRTLTLTTKVQFLQKGDRNIVMYYENGDTQVQEKEILVLDKSLCGNKICDENEELTCLEDCKKFELPTIPRWVIISSIITLIAVLAFAFFKLKYWY